MNPVLSLLARCQARQKRTFFILLISTLTLYLLSYLVMTTRGYYEPSVYGIQQNRNQVIIIAPKGGAPYRWNPYTTKPLTTYDHINGGTLLCLRAEYALFFPLYLLDGTWWHRDEYLQYRPDGLRGFQYPVRVYFDAKTHTYGDYDPR